MGHSQTVVVPEVKGPAIVFPYKCVVPSGWERGSTSLASFLDGIVAKEQPVFHQKRGEALMSLASIIDVDGAVTKGMIANFSRLRKHGLDIAHEHIPSGELYAIFINSAKKAIRVPLPSGVRSGPRHFADVCVVSRGKFFRVTFSSSDRSMVKDALAVARSYVPLGK